MTLTDDRAATPEPLTTVSPAPLLPVFDPGPTDRTRGWLITGFLTVIAAITRFTMLQYPTDAGTPVFDEKHYVPQAYQVLTGGWLEDNPGYGLVVHPPVGKWLIATGEAMFGYNAWGWRFGSAVAGTILVLLVIRIVRRMTRSTLIGAAAGVLMICDGLLFVSSRVGLLDIFLALFATAAFGCLIVDRDDVRARMVRVAAEHRIDATPYGPRLGVRWWRFGAGVLLGLACATKWSGIYFVICFALLGLVFDATARRDYRVRRPLRGVLRRDLGPAAWALGIVPVAVYLGSYWPWFASETGVYRHAVGNQIGTGGAFAFVPDPLRSLWYYAASVLRFHEGLTNSAGNHHPWESKPWTWLMGLRPMLYYYADGDHVRGCGASSCVKAVMLVGTPAIWWLAIPMLGWALWRLAARRDWRYGAVLVGYAAALLPWFLQLDRQMYYFYATALAPFLIMGIALALGDILGPARESAERRGTGLLACCLYLALVIANFAWLWPILTALPISPVTWSRELWLPSWR